MSKLQKTLIGICALGLVLFIGCGAFQDAITPAYIDPAAIDFADANVPLLMPYTTIIDAKYVDKKMDLIYSIGQLEYSYLKHNLAFHLAVAEQLKQAVFSPKGGLGLLIPALSGLGIGAFGIKRPQDKKEIEELKNGNKPKTV